MGKNRVARVRPTRSFRLPMVGTWLLVAMLSACPKPQNPAVESTAAATTPEDIIYIIDAPEKLGKGLFAPIALHAQGETAPAAAQWAIEGDAGLIELRAVDGGYRLVALAEGQATLKATIGEGAKARTVTHSVVVVPAPDRALIKLYPTEQALFVGAIVDLRAELLDADGKQVPGLATWRWVLTPPVDALTPLTEVVSQTLDPEGISRLQLKLGRTATSQVDVRVQAEFGAPGMPPLSNSLSLNPIAGPKLSGISIEGLQSALVVLGQKLQVYLAAMWSDGNQEYPNNVMWSLNGGTAVAGGNSLDIAVDAMSGDHIAIGANALGLSTSKTLVVDQPQSFALADTAPRPILLTDPRTGGLNHYQRSFSWPVANGDYTVVAAWKESGAPENMTINLFANGDDYSARPICSNTAIRGAQVACGINVGNGMIFATVALQALSAASNAVEFTRLQGRYVSIGSKDSPHPIGVSGLNNYVILQHQVQANAADTVGSASYYIVTAPNPVTAAPYPGYQLSLSLTQLVEDGLVLEAYKDNKFSSAPNQRYVGTAFPCGNTRVGAQIQTTCTIQLGGASNSVYLKVRAPVESGSGVIKFGGSQYCLASVIEDLNATHVPLPACNMPAVLH